MLWQKKRDCTYLRVKVDNNDLCQQWCQCDLLLLRNLLTLTDLIIVIIIIWDNNDNIIVVYRAVSSVIMSLTVAATFSEMLWCIMTFWKECHTAFLTVCTIIRNQHITSLNKNCIYVWWSVRQNLLSQNLSLYKENIAIRESKNDNDLRKVNKDVQLLHTDQKNRICIVCCSDENTLIQNESSVCCQIWETNLYDTYMIVVAAVVAAECVVWESVLKSINQREFHIQEVVMKRLKKKTKQKTTCWQAIRTLSTNLTWTTWKSHADKQFTVQCSFLLIKAQSWRKKRGWCHKLNSY